MMMGIFSALERRSHRLARGIDRPFEYALDNLAKINQFVDTSTFGRVFRLEGCGHPKAIPEAHFLTEVRAGMTTFATMSYIIAVNSSILADSGGGCPADSPIYWKCRDEVQRDFVTATATVAGMASIVFGFLTNLPVALAPGMALNAYFSYQVVGTKGSGSVSYGLALTAVFVEGFIFMVLALTGMRHWLVKVIPGTIKTASGAGIGLFLTLVGLSYTSGIGIVSGGISTPTSIAGCPDWILGNDGYCESAKMTNPKMWVGIMCGGMLTALLMAFRVKSAIIIGIALVSVISWPRNTAITHFPDTPDGNARFDFFRRVVAADPLKHTLAAHDWNLSGEKGAHFALALFTFLYVDIIDCTATLYAMARFCNRVDEKTGDFPRSTIAYCTDAAFISIGSLLGCSPVTAFVESGAGIAEGGRTGLTAMITGCCFLVSILFSPLFASIPPWATGCTLILVGCLMIRQITSVNWSYIGDALPSFITIAMIPFSYSVAYGLIAGLFVYMVLNTAIKAISFVSGGRLEAREYDLKEYWTCKPAGEKPWIIRAFTKNRLWEDHNRRHKQQPGFSMFHDEQNYNSNSRSPVGSMVGSDAKKNVPIITMPQHVRLGPN